MTTDCNKNITKVETEFAGKISKVDENTNQALSLAKVCVIIVGIGTSGDSTYSWSVVKCLLFPQMTTLGTSFIFQG